MERQRPAPAEGYLEGELQLVLAAHHEGRDAQLRPGLADVLVAHRHHHGAPVDAAAAAGHQGVGAQELVVHRHREHAPLGHHRRRVLVLQGQRHALGIPGEQVGRHARVDAHGVVQHAAAQLQLLGAADQFAQAHHALRGEPARGVVGLAQGRVFQLAHAHAGPAQGRLAQDQRIRRALHLLIVAAQHQQQQGARLAGVRHHLQRGQVHRRQVAQEVGAAVVGGHDDGVARRQLVLEHRKMVAPVAGQRPQPAGHRAGRLELARRGPARVHQRHLHRPVVALVEEGRGQHVQLGAQRQAAQAELQHALRADLGPQAGVLGLLAFQRVVAYELQAQLVVVDEIGGVQLNLGGLLAAQALLGQRQGLHDLVIEQHLQVRQLRQQRRREGVFQPQPRCHDHFVAPDAHAQAAFAVHAPQAQGVGHSQVAQPGLPGAQAGRGSCTLALGRRGRRRTALPWRSAICSGLRGSLQHGGEDHHAGGRCPPSPSPVRALHVLHGTAYLIAFGIIYRKKIL